jgi:hypothetical protein
MAVEVEAEFDLEIPTPVAVEVCAIIGVIEHVAITEATTNGFMIDPQSLRIEAPHPKPT